MSWTGSVLRDSTGFLVDSSIYVGRDDDAGFYLYRDNLAAEDWVRSSVLGARVYLEEYPMIHQWLVYNGRPFFASGVYYLWWTGSAWRISRRLGGCTGELWDDSLDTPAYTGDEWYSGGTDISGRYEARGSLRGETEGEFEGTAVDVTVGQEGAKHTGEGGGAPWGLYREWSYETVVDDEGGVTEEATDGETEYYAGLPSWSGGAWEYTRSLDMSGGRYSYGRIRHDGTGWAIGTRDSDSGWYEGGEPDLDNNVTFTAHKTDTGTYPGGSEASITVSFDEYVAGDNTDSGAYLAEVGLWL